MSAWRPQARGAEGDRSQGVNGRVLNTITPETDTTCLYFWSLMRNYKLRDSSLTTQLREANAKIFIEDQVVCRSAAASSSTRSRAAPMRTLNIDAGLDAGTAHH